MTDVSTCPDCGRTPVAEGYSRSYSRCDSIFGDGFCQPLTITRLRAELAAAHAKPSPELTAVEVAERAYLDAIYLGPPYDLATEKLRDMLRAKAGR